MPLRLIFPLLTLLFVACGPLLTSGADPAAREKELTFLRPLVPDSLLEYSQVEVPAVENISILGEASDQHLGLRLIPGQKKLHGGIRAEVSVDYPYKPGDTVRYSWKFMLPKGFATDAPANRWWLIGQWHDQPDKGRGETWDDFPSRSPPVLIAIGESAGRVAISFIYGPDHSQKLGPFPIELGQWHSISTDIHWSQKADGKAMLYMDDLTKPIATATGPNMHNAFQHYLKLGMYRHPAINTDNWIYLDDLKITR